MIILLFTTITYWIIAFSGKLSSILFHVWGGILAGVGLALISLLFHLLGKKKSPLLYIFSYFINAVSTGFSIGAYYTYKKQILSFLPCLLYFVPFLFIIYLLYQLVNRIRSKLKSLILCLFLLLPFLICCICLFKNAYASYGFFLLCILFFYLILFSRNLKTARNILSDLSLTSFGLYFIITLIVISVISDGDFFELFLECFDIPYEKKKK